MSNPDRSAARMRKAFARAIAESVHAKEERHSARRQHSAERRERAARRAYLEALRAEALGDWA